MEDPATLLLMQAAAYLAIPTSGEQYTSYLQKEALVQPVAAVIFVDKAVTIAIASPGITTTTTFSCQDQAPQPHHSRTGVYPYYTPPPKFIPTRRSEEPLAWIINTAPQPSGYTQNFSTQNLKPTPTLFNRLLHGTRASHLCSTRDTRYLQTIHHVSNFLQLLTTHTLFWSWLRLSH